MQAPAVEPEITWQAHDPTELFALDPAPTLHLIVAVLADLDPADADTIALRWLGPEQLAHTLLWRSPLRRRHFLAGRIAARLAGALALHLAPDLLHVTLTDTGAPRLHTPDHPHHPISITHSGRWALATASPPNTFVGLDYEVGAGDKPHLAKTVCGPDELARFHLLDPDAGPRFERIWVLKEALLKALEVGLVAHLDHFAVTHISPDGRVRFAASAPLHPRVPFPLPTTLRAAVARFDGHPIAIAILPTPP